MAENTRPLDTLVGILARHSLGAANYLPGTIFRDWAMTKTQEQAESSDPETAIKANLALMERSPEFFDRVESAKRVIELAPQVNGLPSYVQPASETYGYNKGHGNRLALNALEKVDKFAGEWMEWLTSNPSPVADSGAFGSALDLRSRAWNVAGELSSRMMLIRPQWPEPGRPQR